MFNFLKTDPQLDEERILGTLWGSAVGDALGVPVEFMRREDVRLNPVSGPRGYGTHKQPTGTWSDDTSLTLCTIESLLKGFDSQGLAQRFIRWYREGYWTPHGKVFDIGISTSEAIRNMAGGISPETAGGKGENSNGNGSLMRIAPLALYDLTEPKEVLLDHAHRCSALTHLHPRAKMACGLFCLVQAHLVAGQSARDSVAAARTEFVQFYQSAPAFSTEMHHFEGIDVRLEDMPEENISASGYVMDTLKASIWCLLTSKSFKDTVLKAVNLGGDTDTTGAVTGALAGGLYGVKAIPETWRMSLARNDDLNRLFNEFAGVVRNRISKPV